MYIEKVDTNCLHCGSLIKYSRNATGMYCNTTCQRDYQFSLNYAKFVAGENNVFKTHKSQRRALIKRDGNCCSCCKISDWQGKLITFEVDHADGNADNNTSANLRLLCPNCHSQTDTYKGKNRGKGREWRLNLHHKRLNLAKQGLLQ